MATVTVYSKPGCHLCDVVHDALLRLQAEQPFEIVKVNIEDDPALMTKYGHQIPVVLLNGKFVFRYKIDEARMRDLIREVNFIPCESAQKS